MADEIKEPIQEPERLSSEVVAFCELIARIMMRCLRERNPHVMEVLSLSFLTEEVKTGGTHDAA